MTNVVVSGSTTLSGGSVVAATITLSSLSLPAFGAASPTGLSANSDGGNGQGKKAYLVPAIVGSVLGTLALLLLLFFCLWRRKKRAMLRKMTEHGQQGQQEMEEVGLFVSFLRLDGNTEYV